MSSWSFRCLYLRFACARLSNPYLTYLLRLLTETFTTTAFDRSRFRQFEASSHKAAPMDLPSSLIQHRVLQRVLDTTAHRTGLKSLDLSGSSHPMKAAAFRRYIGFIQLLLC